MADSFDPYHKWLGIPPKDQPPNHYRLLAIELFESDPDVIESAADQRMAHVRTFQAGQNSVLSQRILNELSAAKICLLNPQKKADYDRQLRRDAVPADAAAKLPLPPGEGRGVGVSPRPLPQAKPLAVEQPAPVVIASSPSTSDVHRRKVRKKPAWQQTAVLAGAGALAIALAVVVYVVASGGWSPGNGSHSAPKNTKTVAAKSVERPQRQTSKPTKQAGKATAATSRTPTRASEPPLPHDNDAPQPQSKLELPPIDTVTGDRPESRSPSTNAMVGASIDLLKQVDPKRDSVRGTWQKSDDMLTTPDSAYSLLMLPVPPSPEYRLTIGAERLRGVNTLAAGLVVGGRPVMAEVDAWDSKFSGLDKLDDRQCDDNESTRAGHFLDPGRPCTLVYTVRANAVTLEIDGTTVIRWTGDPKRLSMPDIFKLPEPRRLAIASHESVFRLSKIEISPLAPERSAGQVAATASKKASTGLLKVFEDEPEFVAALNAGNGAAELVRNETYSGKASVMVTGQQLFAESLPGLNVKIRHKPTAPDEYRYLRFAWKKRGGGQIWLQLHFPSNWHRYHAGPNHYGAWPGIGVAEELPTEFAVVTRDVASDFGEFTLDGIALTPFDGECAWFDHIYLARTLEDFERIEVSPRKSRGRKFADLSPGNKTSQALPDEAAQKKAKQELQKKYAADINIAKSPDQKRRLAERLMEDASKAEENEATAYTLCVLATDVAESAGDLDLAWQATDQLAESFAVDVMALRQQSLTEVAKAAKSSEQARELTAAACRLLAAALAAGQPTAVKKVGSQAQSLAKRSKDTALIKEVAARTRDAGKLAAEFESVAAARETLKTMPDEPQANFTVGHYELCAAGDWDQALPKLAKSSDANWKRLAQDELDLARNMATPQQQSAAAEAWWSRAESEPWPGKHHLRMRCAQWYQRAWRSLTGEAKTRAVERFREMLATDDGLPNWELFDIDRSQRIGDFVRLDRRSRLRTLIDYDGPIDVSFVARTDKLNIRLFSHTHESVIWNWELNPSELRVTRPDGRIIPSPTAPLEPDRWYTFRYLITPQGMTIFANGQPVFSENQVYKRFRPSPVGVNGAMGSVIDVKKLVVRPL